MKKEHPHRFCDRHPTLYEWWESLIFVIVLFAVSAVVTIPFWVPQTFGSTP